MNLRFEGFAEELGISSGYIGGNGDERYSRCPFHEGTSMNFAFNLNHGRWICFREDCVGGGTVTRLVSMLLRVSYTEAVSYVHRWEEGYKPDITAEELRGALVGFYESESAAPFVRDFTNLTRERWPNWWPERGLGIEEWGDWDLMMDEGTGDVVIPVLDIDQQVVGEVRRRMPGVEPKYLYSRGFSKSETLFGVHRARSESTLVLCEGTLDAMWLWKHGLQGLAVLGSHLSTTQKGLLRRLFPSAIVLAFDADDAGEEATRKAIDALSGEVTDLRVVILPEGAKDVQDVRDGSVGALIRDAVPALQYSLMKG